MAKGCNQRTDHAALGRAAERVRAAESGGRAAGRTVGAAGLDEHDIGGHAEQWRGGARERDGGEQYRERRCKAGEQAGEGDAGGACGKQHASRCAIDPQAGERLGHRLGDAAHDGEQADAGVAEPEVISKGRGQHGQRREAELVDEAGDERE